MKLEQGYGTLQEDIERIGYINSNGKQEITTVNFKKGARLYAVVEKNDNTKDISSSLRHDDGKKIRVSGNVFNKNNKVRLIK